MIIYPRNGERWQHIKGWTVYIIGIKYCDSVAKVNPEFYREVRFIYESSGKYTEMPFAWFRDVYRKVTKNNEHSQSKQSLYNVGLSVHPLDYKDHE